MERKTKKSIGLLLAAVLLIGAAVGVTLAYLTATTAPVTNTFVAGKLNTENFILTEHQANKDEAGKYTLNMNATVQENEYTVVPGNNLPKDPYITVTVDDSVKAFLFIDVDNTLPEELTWSVDDAHWMELMNNEETPAQVTKNGHPVWVYKADGTEAARFSGELKQTDTNIIKNQTIIVPTGYDPAGMAGNKKLKFNAYLCQADGFDSALAAWNACFGTTTP